MFRSVSLPGSSLVVKTISTYFKGSEKYTKGTTRIPETEKVKTLSTDKNELAIKQAILDLHIYMTLQKIQNKATTIIDSLPKKSRKRFLKWTVKLLTKQEDINPTELRRKIAVYFIEKGTYNW